MALAGVAHLMNSRFIGCSVKTSSRVESLNGPLFPRPLSDYALPRAHLDWILGFSKGMHLNKPGSVQLVASMSPTVACLVPSSLWRDAVTARKVKRLHTNSRIRNFSFTSLDRLNLGSYYSLATKLQVFQKPYPEATTHFDEQPVELSVTTVFNDADGALFLTGTNDLPSSLRSLAERHATLQDGVGFFVACHDDITVVIPCSELLRACYGGAVALRSYLAAHPLRDRYESASNRFGGFAYGAQKVYPYRVARNIDRAEKEIRELLPRAITLGKHFAALPILIRPPFTGRVKLRGRGFIDREGKSASVLIVSGLQLGSWTDFGVEELHQSYEPERFTKELPFAPILTEWSIALTELDAHIGCRGSVFANYDIRTFRAQQ